MLSAGDADAEVAGVELITGMVGTAVCVSIKLGCDGGADENVLAEDVVFGGCCFFFSASL